jgi:hypothetical protein
MSRRVRGCPGPAETRSSPRSQACARRRWCSGPPPKQSRGRGTPCCHTSRHLPRTRFITGEEDVSKQKSGRFLAGFGGFSTFFRLFIAGCMISMTYGETHRFYNDLLCKRPAVNIKPFSDYHAGYLSGTLYPH